MPAGDRRTVAAVLLVGLLVMTVADAAASSAPGCADAPAPPSSVPRTVIGAPAYFYPGDTWSAALRGGSALRYLVVNPANGPGASPDPAYAATVSAARDAGVEVLGYVHTEWGRRPAAAVLADAAAYRAWYGVTGVFLDEAATSRQQLAYYRLLAERVRRGHGVVALNPGTAPDEAYLDVADLLVVFEGTYADYRYWAPPDWQGALPRERLWHLVYGTPSGSLRAALRLADRRGAGVVYVTDDDLDNPWDRLPSYWDREVAQIRSLGGLESRR